MRSASKQGGSQMKSQFRFLPVLVVLVGLSLLFVLVPTQTRRQVRGIAANSQVAANSQFTTNLEFAPLIVLAPDDNQTPTAGPFACVDPDGHPRKRTVPPSVFDYRPARGRSVGQTLGSS